MRLKQSTRTIVAALGGAGRSQRRGRAHADLTERYGEMRRLPHVRLVSELSFYRDS